MSDKVLVPVELTAENGAKAALMGEFSVPFPVYCPDRHDLTDMSLEADFCETCRNTGEITHTINVPWVTIKEIWKKAIEVVAAPVWVKCSDRIPTEEDKDYEGNVFGLTKQGNVIAVHWSLIAEGLVDCTRWTRSGLKKPSPPE